MNMEEHPETIKLYGRVHITAFEKDENGVEHKIKDKLFDNTLMNVGKDSILKYIGGAGLTGGGYANTIGVGDSTAAIAVTQVDLQASSNKLWKTISTADKAYVRPTLYVSADFGYSCANFTWNEVGIADSQGTPPTGLMWARQLDCTPLVKTSAKRAIVEWQLSL